MRLVQLYYFSSVLLNLRLPPGPGHMLVWSGVEISLALLPEVSPCPTCRALSGSAPKTLHARSGKNVYSEYAFIPRASSLAVGPEPLSSSRLVMPAISM